MCFEVLCHLQNAVARLVHGRECPVCFQRTRHQEAHAYVNHLGEPST
jgi:hypothetical protein